MDHSSQGTMRSQAGKHQFPEESESCSKMRMFLLALAEGCSNCNDISSSGALLYFHELCAKTTLLFRREPGSEEFIPIYPTWHLPRQHQGSWEKMFLDLVAAYSLTLPSLLQPFLSPAPSTLPLSPKGKSSFPDFLSVRDSQGKGPPRCSLEKARVLWKGRRKMRELG